MARTDNRIHRQYGALPFSIAKDGAIRVLLVTTRRGRNWMIPKGWPIGNMSPARSAAREAYEEAGLVGTVVSDEPFGVFHYTKRQNAGRATAFEVWVYLLSVERQLRKWPEKRERDTRWMIPEDAAALVEPTGLADLLLRAAGSLATPTMTLTPLPP